MREDSIITYLKTVGWGAILTYPLLKLASVMTQANFLRQRGMEPDLVSDLALVNLIPAVFEIPLKLAIPVLCLFAASYLKKQTDTLETIFE